MAESVTHGFGVDADWNALYLDGEWVGPGRRDAIPVENPATREEIYEVPAGTPGDVDEAFAAATAAQSDWAAAPPQERAEVVQRAIGLLQDHQDDLANLLVTEAGSTRLKVGLELEELAPGMMAEAASFPTRSQGRHADSVVPGKENEVHREPVGVVGVITPWNFPFHLSMRAVAPALALGNAVVLKPAEDTPVTGGLALARLFEAAGLPDGVLNVVPGYGEEAGERLAGHPDLDVLSFTGSTETGKHVAGRAVQNLALPALELGGNNPLVVLDDADLDAAVDAGMFGSFVHQGQVCISINRHLVHEDVAEEYAERLADRAADLVVGDPADPETDIGPIINESQRDEMLEYLAAAREEGAEFVVGGGHEDLFVEPTVITGITNDAAPACNEHFGPIAPVVTFADDEEAVELANDTEYGLAAGVFSEDLARAKALAERVDAGMVHVNDQTLNDEPHIPFGGVKGSGMGRYNTDAILREFTRERWISIQHEPREFPL
ncbi:MAG: aldehyde dehydrogenase family protein [Haloferacaceae archaeon]